MPIQKADEAREERVEISAFVMKRKSSADSIIAASVVPIAVTLTTNSDNSSDVFSGRFCSLHHGIRGHLVRSRE